MSKIKILMTIILLLLLINGSLVFLLMSHNKRPHGDGPKRYIIEKLHFDDQQIQAYEISIKEHRRVISDCDSRILNIKNQLYLELQTGQTQAHDSLIAEINKLQFTIETAHYRHFADIKRICTPKQLPAYNQLLLELTSLFTHPPKKR